MKSDLWKTLGFGDTVSTIDSPYNHSMGTGGKNPKIIFPFCFTKALQNLNLVLTFYLKIQALDAIIASCQKKIFKWRAQLEHINHIVKISTNTTCKLFKPWGIQKHMIQPARPLKLYHSRAGQDLNCSIFAMCFFPYWQKTTIAKYTLVSWTKEQNFFATTVMTYHIY